MSALASGTERAREKEEQGGKKENPDTRTTSIPIRSGEKNKKGGVRKTRVGDTHLIQIGCGAHTPSPPRLTPSHPTLPPFFTPSAFGSRLYSPARRVANLALQQWVCHLMAGFVDSATRKCLRPRHPHARHALRPSPVLVQGRHLGQPWTPSAGTRPGEGEAGSSVRSLSGRAKRTRPWHWRSSTGTSWPRRPRRRWLPSSALSIARSLGGVWCPSPYPTHGQSARSYTQAWGVQVGRVVPVPPQDRGPEARPRLARPLTACPQGRDTQL